jgi:DNA-binding NarL/FixJ family response regulator
VNPRQPINITFDVDDPDDCSRAVNELGAAIWQHHGQEMARRLFSECALVSKRALAKRKNIRLLAVFRRSAWGVEKTAAYIAERNKSLGRDFRFGPTGNKVIARLCHISEATVKVHLKAILRKTNARNRTQAAIWAIEHGLADANVAP